MAWKTSKSQVGISGFEWTSLCCSAILIWQLTRNRSLSRLIFASTPWCWSSLLALALYESPFHWRRRWDWWVSNVVVVVVGDFCQIVDGQFETERRSWLNWLIGGERERESHHTVTHTHTHAHKQREKASDRCKRLFAGYEEEGRVGFCFVIPNDSCLTRRTWKCVLPVSALINPPTLQSNNNPHFNSL